MRLRRLRATATEATIGEKGAEETSAKVAQVKKFADALNGQNAVIEVGERGAEKTAGVLGLVKRAVASLSGKNATVEVGERGAAKTAAELTGLKALAGSLDGKNVSLIVDKGGQARNAIAGVASGFSAAQAAIGAVVVGLPSLIAGVAGLVPVLISAAGATLQLAAGLSQGLAGAAVIGGTAVIGAAAGLGIYAKAVSSTVSASRSAYQALNENAKKHLEMRRNQILNTSASVAFNKQIDKTSIALAGVQAEIGNRVFPAFTRLTALFTSSLPKLTPPLYRLVDGVTAVGESFVTSLLKGQRFGQLSRLLNFVASSGISAAKIIANIGTGLLAAIQPVLPTSTRLLGNVRKLTAGFSAWANSARGARALSAGVAGLEKRMGQLWRVVANTSSGLAGLFGALGANNGIGGMLTGLIRLTAQFKNVTAEGSRGRKIIVSFMTAAQPILRETAATAGTLVKQVFGLGNALVHARDKSTGMSLVASVLRNIRDALPPIRRLLQDTFIALGPELGPLIQNLAKLAETFAGQTPALVQFLHNINLLLTTFNRLPTPVKNNIANIVAMGAIMKATGATSVLGFAGHLLTVLSVTAAIRGKTGPAGTAIKLLGNAASLAGRGISGLVGWIGRGLPAIARVARGAFSAARGLGGLRAALTVLRGVAVAGATSLAGIAAAVIGLVAAVGYFSAKYRTQIVGVAQKAVNTIGRFGQAVPRALLGMLHSAGRIAGQTVSAVGASLRRLPGVMVTAVHRAVGPAVKALYGFGVGAGRAARRAVSIVASDIGRLASVMVGGARRAVGGAVKSLGSLAGGTARSLGGMVAAAGRGIGRFVSTLVSGATRGASTAVRVLMSLPGGAGRAMGGLVANVGRGISSAASSLISGSRRGSSGAISALMTLPGGAARALGGAVSAVRSGASSIVSVLGSGARTAVSAALSAFAGLASGVGRAVGSAVSAARSGASGIINAFRGLSLYSIGQNLMIGLANGIVRSAGAVYRALGGVIGNAVAAAKKKLHIRSPSRVFADMGFQIGEGLEGGILGSVPAVEKAARHMADAAIKGAKVNTRLPIPGVPVYRANAPVAPRVSPSAVVNTAPARMEHAVTYSLWSLGGVMDAQVAALRHEFAKLREDNARLSRENLHMAKALTRSDYFVTAVDEANYVASTAEARRGGGK